MDKNKRRMASRILNLTLEIIYLITGKEYAEVKTSSEGGWRKNQGPPMKRSSNLLLSDKNCSQKILKLTSKITELLTAEVPIRYEDITMHLSMEEWEYIEEHKDLYKDVMMEDHQSLISPDESGKKNKSERCSSPLYSQDYPEEEHIPEGKDLNEIEVIVKEETYIWGDQQCKEEEIPIDISPDVCNKGLDGRFLTSRDSEVMFSDFIKYNFGEHSPILPSVSQRREIAFDSGQACIPLSHTVKQSPGGGQVFGECGKNVKSKSNHSVRRRNKRPFSCSECPKCFTRKSDLLAHLKTHTERQFPCQECGRCFKHKSYLVQHQRIHTGKNLFPCQECGKRFTQKLALVEHWRTHTGEKPFPCSECGKSFTTKSNLFKHQKIHKRERSNFHIEVIG